MAKRGLGKGLEALLPKVEESKNEVLDISIDKIDPNKDQPRKTFEEKALKELSQSVKKHGIISPIIVSKNKDRYTIIAGERRYRAAQLAGLDKIPCLLLDVDIETKAKIALIENLQREDLNPIEEALAYKKLMEDHSYTQEQLAEAMSKSRSSIANILRLLSLSEEVKKMLANSQISLGHAKLLVGLEAKEQISLAKAIVDKSLSVRAVEDMLANNKSKKPKTASVQKLDADMLNFERQLKLFFGKSAKLKGDNKKGKIVLSYNSTDELNNIYNIINKL